MSKSAAPKSKIIRKSAADIPKAGKADLSRLHSAMEGPVDTSEIRELGAGFDRLTRDSSGNRPVRKSVIRDAILEELSHREMTPYRLWQEARVHCPTLSQSAVHEFIKGRRQLELPYAEALMAAVQLRVVRVEPAKKRART